MVGEITKKIKKIGAYQTQLGIGRDQYGDIYPEKDFHTEKPVLQKYISFLKVFYKKYAINNDSLKSYSDK